MTKPLCKQRCDEIIDDAKMWYKIHKAKNCVQLFYDENGLRYNFLKITYGLNNRREARLFADAYIGLVDKMEAKHD